MQHENETATMSHQKATGLPMTGIYKRMRGLPTTIVLFRAVVLLGAMAASSSRNEQVSINTRSLSGTGAAAAAAAAATTAATTESPGEDIAREGFLSKSIFGAPQQAKTSATVQRQDDPDPSSTSEGEETATTDQLGFSFPENSTATPVPPSSSDTAASTNISGLDRYSPCPPGYICSRYAQESCESVRQIPISLGLGDIHAGLYCPGRSDRLETGYENCDVGFYCPNSTSQVPCPEGYFCPHKTAKPEIKCRSCPTGATTLVTPSYAYTILVLAVVLMLLVVAFSTFRRYNRQRHNQFRELQRRTADGLRDVAYKRRHLKKLKLLKPKLKLVEKRLRKEFGSEVRMELVISSETEDGKIIFKAEKLFDALDRDKYGELAYSDLNRLLKLSRVQFREFVTRMNEAAGEPPETEEVERHVFVTQFLRIFDVVCHLQATPEEASHVFDEIAKQGVTSTGEVPHRLFYTSLLADFLTDAQINALVKDFQRTKELHDGEELEHCVVAKKIGKQPSQKQKKTSPVYRYSIFGLPERSDTTSREEFVARYPTLLAEVTQCGGTDPGLFTSQLTLHKGIDVTFQEVSVSVKVKDRPVKILSKVTGRLGASTMTAVMGGAGTGKTSLLRALSGRTFSGTVTGKIKINGHHTTLETHANIVGFVPEDDTMYGELTVRENFIFSGLFQLPEGTPLVEIEDLADVTMANLELSRVMHSPVRDALHNQIGLCDVQRKRASIGLELMKKPRIMFVERPTKGLDASSALLIIRSLKKLVDVQGITVCTTLDQSRRDTFELFDSLILLGGGGRLVYHGKVTKVGKYFNSLNYYLPAGESLTDWLLDISTGRLPPPARRSKQPKRVKPKVNGSPPGGDADSRTTGTTAESSGESGVEKKRVKRVTFAIAERTPSGSDEKENLAGHTTKPFDSASEQAKAKCELLHEYWLKHVKDLPRKKGARYDAPEPFSLPKSKKLPPFINQLGCQVQRLLILSERNWLSRFVDTTVIIVAVILITLMDDVAQPTQGSPSAKDVNYDSITGPGSEEAIILEFPNLFAYAIEGIKGDIQAYSLKVGVIFAILMSLAAIKNIATHRPEFFREAASGYNVAAYFGAQNIAATVVHSFQAVVASLVAFCLRNSLSSWSVYVINFLMLSWVCVSWGLLFPLLIPEKYVAMTTAFFVAFFALLFSGATTPISFEVIYDNGAAEVASGLLSSTRFFVEAMAVTEARCLPIQSGFTDLEGKAVKSASFQMLHYGSNDFGEINQRSCNGWFWGTLPSLFVGLSIRWLALGAIHLSNRAKQAKKPFGLKDTTAKIWFIAYMLILAGLLGAALAFMLRKES